MSSDTVLFFGNGSTFSLLVDVRKATGAVQDLSAASVVASLVNLETGAELIADVAQSGSAPDAVFASGRVNIQFPAGASGTDASALTGLHGDLAYVQLSFTISGVTTTIRIPGSVLLLQGH